MVAPWRITPRDLSPGSSRAASRAPPRYHRNRKPPSTDTTAEASRYMTATASSRASRTRWQRAETEWVRSRHSTPVPSSRPRRRRPSPVRRQRRVAAVTGAAGGEVRQSLPPQPVQVVVGRFLVHSRYGGQFQPVQEGHGRQDPQRLPFPFLNPHSLPPTSAPDWSRSPLRRRFRCQAA